MAINQSNSSDRGTLVVGASDAAYVYGRSGSTWLLVTELEPVGPTAFEFGYDVAIDEDWIAVVDAGWGGSHYSRDVGRMS